MTIYSNLLIGFQFIKTDKYLLLLTDRFSDLDLECDEGDCECDVLYSGMAMLYSLGLSY